jgi:histidinol-phosphatase (PHP family)
VKYRRAVSLPADSHVHSEWSWDAANGDMAAACTRALELGLPAVAFTEHLDHTVWRVAPEDLDPDGPLAALCDAEGRLVPPAFDAENYLEAVQQCRDRFPQLRILSGVEVGEPHRHAHQVAEALRAGRFDRILGSLHTLADGDTFAEPPSLLTHLHPAEVLRRYLAEAAVLIEQSDVFDVLAHLDYPMRYWPSTATPFVPTDFEEEFRHVLRLLAQTGRALELSTVVPLHVSLLSWWRDEGGDAITFGSDAHQPDQLAQGFRKAVHMAEAHGFRPSDRPYDLWRLG